jgi:hypothetical protein
MKSQRLKTSEYPMIQMDSLESASNSLHLLSCLWLISRWFLNKCNNLLLPLSTINLQIILLIILSLSTERAARIVSTNSRHSNLVQLSKFKFPQSRARLHQVIRDPWHRKEMFLKGMDLCFKIHLLKTSMMRVITLRTLLPFPKEQCQWDKVRKKLLHRLPKTTSLLIQTLRWHLTQVRTATATIEGILVQLLKIGMELLHRRRPIRTIGKSLLFQTFWITLKKSLWMEEAHWMEGIWNPFHPKLL